MRAYVHCLDGVSVDADQSDPAGLNLNECRGFLTVVGNRAPRVHIAVTDDSQPEDPSRPGELTAAFFEEGDAREGAPLSMERKFGLDFSSFRA